LLLWGVLLLALFARTWQITELPAGLFPDQAANGEDALAILHGDLHPFYERGNGREALFFYLQAAMIAVFGIGVWPMFLASALVGIATVGVTFAAGRRLFGPVPGLLAALFLATSPWHVTLSRTGFRAVLVPLFIALTFFFAACLVSASTAGRRRLSALAMGISFGLGWYTYIAYRVFAVVAFLFGFLLLVADGIRRPRFLGIRRFKGVLTLALAAAAITVTPLAHYFLKHPDAFAGRAGHVSVFNPDLNHGDVAGTITDVAERSVLAFFTAGDVNPRHNVPGAPFLSSIPATFFLVGLLVAIRRSLQFLHRLFHGRPTRGTAPYLILLLTVVFMLAPAVATAEGIPHGLRSIGEIPAVFLLAGIGGARVLHAFRRFPSPAARRLSEGIVSLLLLLTMAADLVLYFSVYASSPVTAREYRADLTEVSRYLNERARLNQPQAYLALDAFSEQTVHFLTTEEHYPYRLVRPEESAQVTLGPREVIVFTQSTLPDAERYALQHADAQQIERKENRFGETTMIVFALTQ
jgi:4-amino-4-deoxy-L-arabinose transferase-like glycosyltransferase